MRQREGEGGAWQGFDPGSNWSELERNRLAYLSYMKGNLFSLQRPGDDCAKVKKTPTGKKTILRFVPERRYRGRYGLAGASGGWGAKEREKKW